MLPSAACVLLRTIELSVPPTTALTSPRDSRSQRLVLAVTVDEELVVAVGAPGPPVLVVALGPPQATSNSAAAATSSPRWRRVMKRMGTLLWHPSAERQQG